MKTIKLILAITVFTITMVVNASENPTNKKNKSSQVTEEIVVLLRNPYFEVNNDLQAQVKFIINQNNEIVILSVETTSEELRSFIKYRMNYVKIESLKGKEGRIYSLPVLIESEMYRD